MKKLFAIILALTLVLSLNAVVFAETQTGNPTSANKTMPADQQNIVNIPKTYKLTNAGTTSPEETVSFTWAKVGVENAATGITNDNMPGLVSVTLAKYNAGAATTEGFNSNLVVTLPAYTGVGVYTYTITETDGNMAGVTYGANSTPIKLVVTVTQGEDGLLEIAAIHTEGDGTTKTDTFTNEYSAGTLAISKTVTGNMGDTTKYFDITVTLTAPSGDTVGAPITITGGSNTSNATTIATTDWTNGTASVSLKIKDGDTIKLNNVPYGVTYEVVELDGQNTLANNAKSSDGYTVTYTSNTGEIESDSATASIVNDKEVPVDTGITLDNIPYILLLAAGIATVVVMFIRKRRTVED